MSGKGSAPRPFNVSNEEYANRWDAIFGRDLKTPEVTPEEPPKWEQLELPLDTPEDPLSQPVAYHC